MVRASFVFVPGRTRHDRPGGGLLASRSASASAAPLSYRCIGSLASALSILIFIIVAIIAAISFRSTKSLEDLH